MNTSLPQVLGETAQWIVVSKPSGWLTIPGRSPTSPGKNSTSFTPLAEPPVLATWLNEQHGKIWVVHRIDRETSGVVLFAKTAEDHQLANRWFQERKTKKIYHCLSSGIPSAPILKISLPIEGAPSTTQIEIRESYQEGFYARVTPRTGRRHQIRIHLAKSGFPIWGDELYGGPKNVQVGQTTCVIPRVCLHASSLELPTQEKFEAPLPADFKLWLDQLQKEGHRV